MSDKQSIFGRVTQLARANINAMIDSAEDPGKMLDQLIRDYTANISEAEQAVAQTIGNLRMMEEDLDQDRKAQQEWGAKALAASRKADELRAAGDAAGADKFDDLAKVAIGKQLDAEREVTDGSGQVATQTDVTEKLKQGLGEMKDKLADLKKRRDNLVARAKTAQAQSQVQDAVKSINILDPTSEVSRSRRRSGARRRWSRASRSWPRPRWTPSSTTWTRWPRTARSTTASPRSRRAARTAPRPRR
jgi:phage shock protein A